MKGKARKIYLETIICPKCEKKGALKVPIRKEKNSWVVIFEVDHYVWEEYFKEKTFIGTCYISSMCFRPNKKRGEKP